MSKRGLDSSLPSGSKFSEYKFYVNWNVSEGNITAFVSRGADWIGEQYSKNGIFDGIHTTIICCFLWTIYFWRGQYRENLLAADGYFFGEE